MKKRNESTQNTNMTIKLIIWHAFLFHAKNYGTGRMDGWMGWWMDG